MILWNIAAAQTRLHDHFIFPILLSVIEIIVRVRDRLLDRHAVLVDRNAERKRTVDPLTV